MGRDSILDSDLHSSARGVFGVFCKLFCLKLSIAPKRGPIPDRMGDKMVGLFSIAEPNPNFTGDKIVGLLLIILFSSITSFFCLSASTRATLFFPRSVQDLAADALLYRSWARAPGLRYLLLELLGLLFCLPVLVSLSFGDTFPILNLVLLIVLLFGCLQIDLPVSRPHLSPSSKPDFNFKPTKGPHHPEPFK